MGEVNLNHLVLEMDVVQAVDQVLSENLAAFFGCAQPAGLWLGLYQQTLLVRCDLGGRVGLRRQLRMDFDHGARVRSGFD